MSREPRKSPRFGMFAFLAVIAALVVGYLNDCYRGLGLPTTGSPSPQEAVEDRPAAGAAGAARPQVVVAGEQCRLGDAAARDCAAVCREVEGTSVEIEATAGAQRTVEALRACLRERGLTVHMLSE